MADFEVLKFIVIKNYSFPLIGVVIHPPGFAPVIHGSMGEATEIFFPERYWWTPVYQLIYRCICTVHEYLRKWIGVPFLLKNEDLNEGQIVDHCEQEDLAVGELSGEEEDGYSSGSDSEYDEGIYEPWGFTAY
jgi:hypothetical protein